MQPVTHLLRADSACKAVEGDSLTKSCLPSRPLDQDDVVCEPLDPVTMKVKGSSGRFDGPNFHKLACCDSYVPHASQSLALRRRRWLTLRAT